MQVWGPYLRFSPWASFAPIYLLGLLFSRGCWPRPARLALRKRRPVSNPHFRLGVHTSLPGRINGSDDATV